VIAGFHTLSLESESDVLAKKEDDLQSWISARERASHNGLSTEMVKLIQDTHLYMSTHNYADYFTRRRILAGFPLSIKSKLLSYLFEDIKMLFASFFNEVEEECGNELITICAPVL
jgi:hypothetical protein